MTQFTQKIQAENDKLKEQVQTLTDRNLQLQKEKEELQKLDKIPNQDIVEKLTKTEAKFLTAKNAHAEEIKNLNDTHDKEKNSLASQLFEMERQKLELFTKNQSHAKENN